VGCHFYCGTPSAWWRGLLLSGLRVGSCCGRGDTHQPPWPALEGGTGLLLLLLLRPLLGFLLRLNRGSCPEAPVLGCDRRPGRRGAPAAWPPRLPGLGSYYHSCYLLLLFLGDAPAEGWPCRCP